MFASMIRDWLRIYKIGVLAVVSGLILASCGGESQSSSLPTEAAATSVPTTTRIPTPSIEQSFPYTEVWNYRNESGYTYEMTIALGNPSRMPDSGLFPHPRDSSFELTSACSVNPQLDVVIPAYWSAKATTPGFDTPIGMSAVFAEGGAGTTTGRYHGRGVAPVEGDNRVMVAQDFSDGPKCSIFSSTGESGYGSSSGSFGVRWFDPVPQGSVRTSVFFIVVKGYFSPATPQGDRVLLDWITLRPSYSGSNTEPAMIYRDINGLITSRYGTYSKQGITLSGKIVQPAPPTPTPGPKRPTPGPTHPPTATTGPRVTATARPTTISELPELAEFEVGDQVILESNSNLLTRPVNGSESVGTLEQGTELTISGDAIYNDAGWWWRVDAGELSGWIRQESLHVPD